MTFELLDSDVATELKRRPFTYPEVGHTVGPAPLGYHHFSITRTLPSVCTFADAAAELMTWQVQQRAGLRVSASSAEVEAGAVTIMRLGFARWSPPIPCRVVYVVDETDARGFAYGTLSGHPECGEEAFLLRIRSDGRIEFTVSAFSKPANLIVKLGGFLGRQAQLMMTRRYLRGLDQR